jgi:pimeloyl-ACP methyl ester carboxylesterase
MAINTAFRANTLKVPGADVYYEVRGSGPVLLLMPGGPADATTFRKMENDLARDYTVVTYDPRGLSHSEMTEPLDDARMVQVFADDAHRLLAKVAGDRKSCVFASSGGATIALELAVRHPEQLEVVIVHEPPSPALMEDPASTLAGMEDVTETCNTVGLFPAMQKFMDLIGIHEGPPPQEGEPTSEQLEAQAMMQGNMQFFFGRYIRNLARYEPDIDALEACSCRIVPAVGDASEGQLAHNGALGLARRLGVEPAIFPGGHGGFDERPVEFAARIREVLEG